MSLITSYYHRKASQSLILTWCYIFHSFHWSFEIKELYGELVFELKFPSRTIVVFIRNQADIWDNYHKYKYEIRKKKLNGSFIIIGSNYEPNGNQNEWINIGYYYDDEQFEYDFEDTLVLRWSGCHWSFGGAFQTYDLEFNNDIDNWKDTIDREEIHDLFDKIVHS